MKEQSLNSELKEMNYGSLVEAISRAHEQTQRQATQAVNIALTLRNWLVGYHIFEYEQNGQDRAAYGEKLLENLSKDLKKRLGKVLHRESWKPHDSFMCVIQFRRHCLRNSD